MDDPRSVGLAHNLDEREKDDLRREIEGAMWEFIKSGWVIEEPNDEVDVMVGELSYKLMAEIELRMAQYPVRPPSEE